MIVSDIQTRVKRLFGDEAGVQLTDADLIRYINDGVREMVTQNESLLQKTATADSVTGQQNYALPADTLILQGITYKSPGQLSYTKLEGLTLAKFNEYMDGWDGSSYGTGIPAVFMVYAGVISLFPIPDHTLVAAMKIYYNRVPVDVTMASDTPDIPVIYHPALVKYCMSQAYEMDEDLEAATAKGQQLAGDMKLLRGRSEWLNEESYPTITVCNEDLD